VDAREYLPMTIICVYFFELNQETGSATRGYFGSVCFTALRGTFCGADGPRFSIARSLSILPFLYSRAIETWTEYTWCNHLLYICTCIDMRDMQV
jgi:hypothetical protein